MSYSVKYGLIYREENNEVFCPNFYLFLDKYQILNILKYFEMNFKCRTCFQNPITSWIYYIVALLISYRLGY